MEYHICNNSLPKFHSIFNYKIENYGKERKDIQKNLIQGNSLSTGNKTIWKTKYITFNFDKDELNNFPSEKLETLKKTLYSIPGLGNEEDFKEYQYHYKEYINNNGIEQKNLICFENSQNQKNSLDILDTASLGDIHEYPFLNPSFYISPSIVSSVHISLLTSQIKVKYNPDFTNVLLIKNVISQSGLNILETITSPYIRVTCSHTTNEKISTTTYENPSINELISENNEINHEMDSNDDFIDEFLNSSKDQDRDIMSSIKYQNKYNKSALLELSCVPEGNSINNKIISGICHSDYLTFSNLEKVNRNSTSFKNLENIDDTKKISLHTISFILPKLNRASEAMFLESKLLKISGIKSPVKFDFMKKECTVIYNSYQISVKDIINEMKIYHFDASAISDSFRRLSKDEEKYILSLVINNMNDSMDPLYNISLDKSYNSDSDELNLLCSNNYAHSVNSSSSSTEYMGNSSDNMEIANHSQTNYIEMKNQIDKKSKRIMDKHITLSSKIEKCFGICCILTILSFITPYLFSWFNYITNNSYINLNLHLECLFIILISIPVQFYYGKEIHQTAFNMIKSNKCECYYSSSDDVRSSSLNHDSKRSINDKYLQCSLHSNNEGKEKNHRINRIVILSISSWIIWIYSTIGIFIRLLQMYTNNVKYESAHIYHEYYETSSLLITSYYVMKLLELSAKQYTINNISQFMHLQMKKVVLLTPLDKALSNCNTINERTLKTEWIESIVDVNSLKEGDIIKILPGNRIPYNGSIVFGKTKLDESMISGNTKPVTKTVMDRVISGTMNKESSIYVKILDASNDCTYYSMINFIEDVQLSKSSFHIFTDGIYKYLIPSFMIISIVTLLFWTFGKIDVSGKAINEESLKNNYQIEFGIIFGISVLVIAYPFTMEFAFPIAISVASKIAMKYGILIKDDALTFKKLNLLDIVVFNKDQVITSGNPSIVEIIIDKNFTDNKNLGSDEVVFYEILKALQRYSTNIYAKCIKNYLKKVEMSLPNNKLLNSSWNVIYYHETEGYNVIAKIKYSKDPNSDVLDICMGCEKWMTKQKCVFSMDQSRLSIWTERGYSIIYIAINKVIVGMLGVHDNVRDGTKSLIQCLRDQYHIEPWLLSYDNEASTINTAKQIGINEHHCLYNVLPSEKQEKIKWLQNNYRLNSNKNNNDNYSPFNSDFKLTNNSFDRELDDYRAYQENTNNFNPFNPHGSTNIFSNYNVIAPISSMSRDSFITETNSTNSHRSNSASASTSNNNVEIKIEPEENEEDDDHLIHQSKEINKNMVAYIGNDINDSDVFSTADVGLCLGILNDISLDSSVITTIYQDVQCINKLLHLTKYIINYSYTTIIYILLLQFLLLPIATGLFYPYVWLNPFWIIINLILNIIIHFYRFNNLRKVNF
ncbi:E1-E2 ATPase-domain-containing protein [Neocallimastix sp. 'constans']